MRNLIMLMLAFVSVSVFAQDIKVPSSLIVTEGSYKVDGVERNGFDVVLQGDEKAINAAWVKFASKKYDLKMKAKGATSSGIEFMNDAWSAKQFALKSAVIKDGSGPHFRLWMMFGADVFVNTAEYNTEAIKVKAVVKEFAKAYYVGVFQKQLDDQNKAVESQGKEVSGLNKDQEKNEKSIAKAKKSISKSEKKIEKSKNGIQKSQDGLKKAESSIQTARTKIETKKREMSEIPTGGDVDKEAKNAKMRAKYAKSISKLEGSIAKAEKKKAKYRAAIEKYESTIEKSEAAIRKSNEYKEKKSSSMDKTASDLKKEEGKYKNESEDQEAIKAKIRAIQAL